jgi:hypothetical protein
MHVYLKNNWKLILILYLLIYSNVCMANFSINYAKLDLINKIYVLNANISYKLTETAKEALHNGISLVLVLNVNIQRDRAYLWDKTIANLKLRYEIKYLALSRQYVLKYLNTGITETFLNLSAALHRLGNIKNYPLMDKHIINTTSIYWVYLKVSLDIESLPIVLRPIAYLSSEWHLNSDWYLCPLKAQN